MKVLWGVEINYRCAEIVLTLLRKCHLVDAHQCADFKALAAIKNFLIKFPLWRNIYAEIWENKCDSPGRVGVVARILNILQSCHFAMDSPFTLVSRFAPALSLLNTPKATWAHTMREALRHREHIKAYNGNRKDFLLHGAGFIDSYITCLLLRNSSPVVLHRKHLAAALKPFDGALTKYQQGILEGILSCGVATRDRLFKT